jgi:hypothetical protein
MIHISDIKLILDIKPIITNITVYLNQKTYKYMS